MGNPRVNRKRIDKSVVVCVTNRTLCNMENQQAGVTGVILQTISGRMCRLRHRLYRRLETWGTFLWGVRIQILAWQMRSVRRNAEPLIQNGPYLQGFPHSSVGKGSACSAGDPSSIPGLGRSPGEETGYPLKYSGLDNSMDTVHGVTKSPTRLHDFHFLSREGGRDQKGLTEGGLDLWCCVWKSKN